MSLKFAKEVELSPPTYFISWIVCSILFLRWSIFSRS